MTKNEKTNFLDLQSKIAEQTATLHAQTESLNKLSEGVNTLVNLLTKTLAPKQEIEQKPVVTKVTKAKKKNSTTKVVEPQITSTQDTSKTSITEVHKKYNRYKPLTLITFIKTLKLEGDLASRRDECVKACYEFYNKPKESQEKFYEDYSKYRMEAYKIARMAKKLKTARMLHVSLYFTKIEYYKMAHDLGVKSLTWEGQE